MLNTFCRCPAETLNLHRLLIRRTMVNICQTSSDLECGPGHLEKPKDAKNSWPSQNHPPGSRGAPIAAFQRTRSLRQHSAVSNQHIKKPNIKRLQSRDDRLKTRGVGLLPAQQNDASQDALRTSIPFCADDRLKVIKNFSEDHLITLKEAPVNEHPLPPDNMALLLRALAGTPASHSSALLTSSLRYLAPRVRDYPLDPLITIFQAVASLSRNGTFAVEEKKAFFAAAGPVISRHVEVLTPQHIGIVVQSMGTVSHLTYCPHVVSVVSRRVVHKSDSMSARDLTKALSGFANIGYKRLLGCNDSTYSDQPSNSHDESPLFPPLPRSGGRVPLLGGLISTDYVAVIASTMRGLTSQAACLTTSDLTIVMRCLTRLHINNEFVRRALMTQFFIRRNEVRSDARAVVAALASWPVVNKSSWAKEPFHNSPCHPIIEFVKAAHDDCFATGGDSLSPFSEEEIGLYDFLIRSLTKENVYRLSLTEVMEASCALAYITTFELGTNYISTAFDCTYGTAYAETPHAQPSSFKEMRSTKDRKPRVTTPRHVISAARALTRITKRLSSSMEPMHVSILALSYAKLSIRDPLLFGFVLSHFKTHHMRYTSSEIAMLSRSLTILKIKDQDALDLALTEFRHKFATSGSPAQIQTRDCLWMVEVMYKMTHVDLRIVGALCSHLEKQAEKMSSVQKIHLLCIVGQLPPLDPARPLVERIVHSIKACPCTCSVWNLPGPVMRNLLICLKQFGYAAEVKEILASELARSIPLLAHTQSQR
eukprot:GHVN01041832.1.p1 GENE.GHVN01041832.1~~GHVN01041832.1.p1  ORF type:complete len:765 (+),score=25.95 GHVN01041832.1:62-2356(+)